MANNQNQGFELHGYHAKIYIEGIEFDATSVRPKVTASTARGDTTGTGAYEQNRPDKYKMSLSLSAIRYSTMNPFDSPFTLAPGTMVGILYYEDENETDPTQSWQCDEFLITDVSSDSNAEQGFQKLDFEGVSCGVFYMPGEARV